MTARRLVAEGLGTALLLLVVVGSGIATSADGAASAQLFQHAVAVGVALTALIVVLGPVSGAHFNPVVTLAELVLGGIGRGLAAAYVAAQLLGAALGVVVANLQFGDPAVTLGTTARSGAGLAASELVCTAVLLLVIIGLVRSGRERAVPGAVGAWVGAAVFSTSSACFANPAVTVARTLTDSWTAIRPVDVPAYVVAQLVGALGAVALARWLFVEQDPPTELVVPHGDDGGTDHETPTSHESVRSPS